MLMSSELLTALEQEYGTEISEDEIYLAGKPREYYCDEHGTIVAAVVHDPYDAPSYICPDCHKRLSYRSLDG